MSRRQLPRTTAAILDAATFLPGEIAVDTTNDELRYDGDGSTVGGIVLAKKNASAQLSSSNTFTGALNRFKRVFLSAADAVYDLASNVLATMLYFSSGGTITVGASKQYDSIRHDDIFSLGALATAQFINGNFTLAAGSDATANGYILRGLGTNESAATFKGFNLRALGGAGTGVLVSGALGLTPGASTGTAWGLQLGLNTASRKADQALHIGPDSGTAQLDYGLVFADGTITAIANVLAFADGAARFLWFRDGADTTTLFDVSSAGALTSTGLTNNGNALCTGTLDLGHATANTLSGSGGNLYVEGNLVYRAGGTDVPIADGGTNASTDRGACANLKTWYVLAASAVAVSRNSANVAGDVTPQTLATVTIPANAMGPNGVIRITSTWSWTNSVNVKHPRITFGGTDYMDNTPTTTQWWRAYASFANVNNASSQKGNGQQVQGGWGATATSANGQKTSSVNTTSNADITFTAAWDASTAAETITLESYVVEVFYQA